MFGVAVCSVHNTRNYACVAAALIIWYWTRQSDLLLSLDKDCSSHIPVLIIDMKSADIIAQSVQDLCVQTLKDLSD